MPGRNGTGPMGYGPLTGRGLGPCGGKMAHRGNFYGRRMGGGFGRNFGGAGYYSPANLTAEEQKELLGERKAYLESELTICKNSWMSYNKKTGSVLIIR